jgi:hypothetical protein
MKKALGLLYDYRSSLVHGGLRLIHPVHSEILDRTVDDEYDRLMTLFEFGFSVLLAGLQVVVESGWIGIQFPEQMIGTTGSSISGTPQASDAGIFPPGSE